MFSAFLATGGGDEEEEEGSSGVSEGEVEEEREGGGGGGGGGGVFSFFEMAKEVAANVQNSTTEIVQSVAVTDWTKELRDFGSSLQQDTQEMVEETKAAVKDNNESIGLAIPKSKEDVQESMELLGNTLEAFGKNLIGGTSELLSQVKETVNQEMQAASIKHQQLQKEKKLKQKSRSGGDESEGGGGEEEIQRKRFEEKVNAMQRDSGTYCDEPEDFEYFEMWQSHFDLGQHEDQVQETLKGNAFMLELQERIVPLIVDRGTFWTQYFFRLHMIKLEEGMASRLTEPKRVEEEEEKKGNESDERKEEEGAEAEACATTDTKEGAKRAAAVPVEATEAEEPKEETEKSEAEAEVVLSSHEEDSNLDDGRSSSCASSVETGSPRHDMGLALSEPDAATASDSSANDWINVKQAKNRGSPASQSPKTLESLNEQQQSTIKAEEEEGDDPQDCQPSSPLKGEKVADHDKDLKEEDLSPLPSPAGGKYDESLDDDDIDEDWGEM